MSFFINAAPSRPRVRAVQALLVYEDETLASEPTRYALTTHEITHTDQGVQIGAGRLLGLQDQQSLLDILIGSLTTQSHFLPTEIICHSTARLAWIVPGKVRPMWFRFNKETHRLDVPWPNLIFCASQKSLGLAAYTGSRRPTQDTPLYHAPLMNVHEQTTLCTGNALLPGSWSLRDRPKFEEVVFATYFTHVNHEHTLALDSGKGVTTAQHYRFWRDLQESKATRYPGQSLVPLRKTASQWLSR